MNHFNVSNRLILNIIAILVMVAFNSADCSKKGSEPTCYMSEEFKSYVVFKEGSYWVYQNQSSIVDTVKIIRTEYTILDSPYSYPSERYTITTESTQNGTKKYFAQCEDGNWIGCNNLSKYTTNFYSPVLFFCCCEQGSSRDNLTFQSQLDSIEVNSSWFYNVKVFESDSIHPQTNKTLYYSQDVGLIMYVDYSENTWGVVDYGISKD